MGAADFVVRVNRSHSVWFGAVDPGTPGIDPDAPSSGDNFTNPTYSPPTVVPNPLDQPIGTSVEFFFRGATAVLPAIENYPASNEALFAANSLDLYGDHYDESLTFSICDDSFTHDRGIPLNQGISFKDGTDVWHDNAAAISGSQYYQVRITWISNPLTGLTPELTAFAMTWSE